MKKILLAIVVLFSINSFSQEIKYKEYSYAEVFELIAAEKDTIFKLSNAFVIYNKETDSLFTAEFDEADEFINDGRKKQLIIDKELDFNNVHFFSQNNWNSKIKYGIINNILFKKKVTFKTSLSASFFNCVFEEKLTNDTREEIESALKEALKINNWYFFIVSNCTLLDGANIRYICMDIEPPNINFYFYKNDIYFKDNTSFISQDNFYLFARNISNFLLTKNTFHSQGTAQYRAIKNIFHTINDNKFNDVFTEIYISETTSFDNVTIENNTFNKPVTLELDNFSVNYKIPFKQFNGIINTEALNEYRSLLENIKDRYKFKLSDSVVADFNNLSISNEAIYDTSMSFKGMLYNFYKSKFDKDDANAVYVEMKDLESARLKYLHHQNPSFDSFFTLKINQFLKEFSAYGTKPSKAIIFSMYVILLFAFVYLLFPNSWDTLGNKRLMSRFEFFQKYLRRNEGMHTIYLEGKQEEISSFNDFKNNLEAAKLELPAFFISWAKPLYNASMFSSRITTRFLKNTDILKGKWKDLTPKQKRWKNIQIGFLLTLGLFYDLFIKALNALMLSINTFTTLGFGEIPIKGLPRYLAIIQGFIGWFMLTIFSVSLISQLLN